MSEGLPFGSGLGPEPVEIVPNSMVEDLVTRKEGELRALRSQLEEALRWAEDAERRLNAHPAATTYSVAFEADVLAHAAQLAPNTARTWGDEIASGSMGVFPVAPEVVGSGPLSASGKGAELLEAVTLLVNWPIDRAVPTGTDGADRWTPEPEAMAVDCDPPATDVPLAFAARAGVRSPTQVVPVTVPSVTAEIGQRPEVPPSTPTATDVISLDSILAGAWRTASVTGQ